MLYKFFYLTLRNGHIDKYQFEEDYCQAAYPGNASQDNITFCYYDHDHLHFCCRTKK